MREILFRGQMKTEKKWIYGNLLQTDSSTYVIQNYVPFEGIEKYEVIPETVCQYTGLTDKNGKKIFEGDICKYYNPEDKDGIAVIREDYAEWTSGIIRQKEIMTPIFYLKCSEEWEVIGNIFDNPELLKEDAENANSAN